MRLSRIGWLVSGFLHNAGRDGEHRRRPVRPLPACSNRHHRHCAGRGKQRVMPTTGERLFDRLEAHIGIGGLVPSGKLEFVEYMNIN